MVQVCHSRERIVKHPDHFDYDHYPRVAYAKMAFEAKRIEGALVRCGISPNLNSRVTKYRKIIEEFTNKATAGELRARFDWILLHQALCEIGQLKTIVEALLQPPILREWSSRLAQLVSGQALPQNEVDQSAARDLQFELNIAAHCRAAGYIVEPKEPDVLVHGSEGVLGIAVKRPKSAKRLERHIHKASKQIQSSGVDGLVAIDLSLIHNPGNRILLTQKPEEGIAAVRRAVDGFAKMNINRIRSLVKTPNVFGLVAYMSSLCFNPNTTDFATATRWTIVNLCEMTDERYERLRKFSTRFAIGVGQTN
jgi:hypothetical protein